MRRIANWCRVLALALPLAMSACSLNLQKSASAEAAPNQCSSNADCSGGSCSSGTCVAFESALSTLLIEVSPPTTVPYVGGLQFLHVAKDLARSNADYPINLPLVLSVHGFVSLPKGCSPSTVAAEVVLTPREQTYGLPVVTYVAQTSTTPASGTCFAGIAKTDGVVQHFDLDVPAGHYDAYVHPLDSTPTIAGAASDGGAAPNSACNFVPKVFSNLSIGVDVPSGAGVVAGAVADQCLPLPEAAAKEIDVAIQWPKGSSLDGWTVDVVHPITGQLLSDRTTLTGVSKELPAESGTSLSAQTTTGYATLVHYSPLSSDDAKAGHELLRLNPPVDPASKKPVPAPTVAFEVSGLQVFGSTHRAIVPFFLASESLPSPVSVSVPVKSRGANVAGAVTFTATKLDGIEPGAFASFAATEVVGADGNVGALLLPGSYRVRVVPVVGSGLAAAETELSVPLGPTTVVVEVPDAMRLAGTAQASNGALLDGASVQALPASVGVRDCSADAAACTAAPLGVIDKALGQDAFLPRPVSSIVDDHGGFVLPELDCGDCKGGNGALFDLSVRPVDGTGVPWASMLGINVLHVANPDHLAVVASLPVVERGVVEIPSSKLGPATPVPNALIARTPSETISAASSWTRIPSLSARVLPRGRSLRGRKRGASAPSFRSPRPAPRRTEPSAWCCRLASVTRTNGTRNH